MKVHIRSALFACILAFVATGACAFTAQTGHWWNPSESGTGYNIDIHNGVLVVTIFSYKANGDSEWYLAGGPMSADQRQFSGTLDKYRNGQCISCPYAGVPTRTGNDGSISITFHSETTATVFLPGGRTTNIQPLYPSTSNAGNLNGTYRLLRASVDYLGSQLIDTANGTLIASGTMVVSGNQITQSISVTRNGATISLTNSGTLIDYGTYIVVFANSGGQNRATLVTRGDPFITATNNAGVNGSPPYAEIDQWELVGAGVKSEVMRASNVADEAPATLPGSGIGAALARLR